MKNLTEAEKRVLLFCESKREAAKSNHHLKIILDQHLDFLKTINQLRGDLLKAREEYGQQSTMLRAKIEAYNNSVQERIKLNEEIRYIKDKLARLK